MSLLRSSSPFAASESDEGRASRLHDLTDALLELVFALVCKDDGEEIDATEYLPNSALPLVCKRWRRVYTCSTLLWSRLTMRWGEVLEAILVQGGPFVIPSFGYVTKWVMDRAPVVQHLTYTGCGLLGPTLDQQLLAICREGVRLRRVRLEDAVGSGDGLLRQLASAAGLQEIVLHCRGWNPMEAPLQRLLVSTSALGALSTLNALRVLDLRVDRVSGSAQSMGGALQGLTRMRLEGRLEAPVLPPELLHTMTDLRSLELSNCRLGQFTPSTSEALSRLSRLMASDVLAARPKKKAGITLWEGLRHLPSLLSLQIKAQQGAGMPGNALECPGLRALTLVQTAADSWPTWGHLAVHPNCVARLEEVHLQEVQLQRHISTHQLWRSLASLTRLVWREVREAPSDRPPPVVMTHFQALPPPPGISSLSSLRHLCLEYSQLEEVPPCIYPLSALTRLSLEGNNIQELPPGDYLAGLQLLSLAANRVRKLPAGLHGCAALRTLCLARNPDLVLRHPEVARLRESCVRLERVWVTECNGLAMGHLEYSRLEGSGGTVAARLELGAFMEMQERHPGLVAWGEGDPPAA